MYFVILYSPTEEARAALDGFYLKLFYSKPLAEEFGDKWVDGDNFNSYEVFKLGTGET